MPTRRRRRCSPSAYSSDSSSAHHEKRKRKHCPIDYVWEFNAARRDTAEPEWISFTRPAQHELSRAHAKFQRRGSASQSSSSGPCDLLLQTCGAKYEIDFVKMEERNRDSKRKRCIRRVHQYHVTHSDFDFDIAHQILKARQDERRLVEEHWEQREAIHKERILLLEAEVADHRAIKHNLKEEKLALQDTLDSVQDELCRKADECEKSKQAFEAEKARRRKCKDKLEHVHVKLDDQRAKIREIKDLKEEERQRRKRHEDELAHLRDKLSNQEEEIRETEDLKEEERKRRKRYEDKLARVQDKLNDKREELSEVEALQQEERERRRRYEDMLEEMRGQLDDKEDELSEIEAFKEEDEKKVTYALRRQMEAWRLAKTLDDVPRLAEIHDTSLFKEIEDMFAATAHGDVFNGHPSKCGRMQRASVTRMRQIVNLTQWSAYTVSKRCVQDSHALRRRNGLQVNTTLMPNSLLTRIHEAFPWIVLDEALGEHLLFHGTTHLEAITTQGFNERLCRRSNLYGEGVYFTDESCKAFQYSGKGPEHCIIIARVVLGESYLTNGPRKGERIAPEREQGKPEYGFFESVVAQVGIRNGVGANKLQDHRECVVYNGALAYPEFAIFFTTDD